MDPLLRQVWVTLLCLADDNGQIKHLREYDLIKMAGCEDDQSNDPSDLDRTQGCLEYFKDKEMILLETVTRVTNSNAAPLRTVTLVNYDKRQRENLSNAERQKRYREIHKNEAKTKSNDNNVTQRYDSNARIDKNRIDKNIYIKNSSKEEKENIKLEDITKQQIQHLADEYEVPIAFVLSKIDDIRNYCASTGKKYKDYYATLRKWTKKDAISIRKEEYGKSKITIVRPDPAWKDT